jgi:hypothetical protein
MLRLCLLGALCLLLAGCASLPQNTLAVNEIATYKLESVAVSVPPDAHIWWGNAEREFAEKHGEKVLAELRATKEGREAVEASAKEAINNSPQCKQYQQDEASRRLQSALMGYVGPELRGNQPVRLEVVLHELTIPSAVQRVVIGGTPAMSASATLVDARTGKVLLTYPKLLAIGFAGNGVAGVLYDQLSSDDLYDRVIMNYATQYRQWLLKA